MKNSMFIVIAGFLAIVAAAGCSASGRAVTSEADRVTARQVDRMLTERLYKIDFTRAYPAAGRSFSLSHPYYVSVIGDRVESFLPYFGRAYAIPYGGGEGLRFEAPVSDYRDQVNKRGRRLITFSARTDQDSYNFTLTVFPLGECDLSITPMQKQSISFGGEMDLEPEFEAVGVE